MIVASARHRRQPGSHRLAAGRSAGDGTLAIGVLRRDHDDDTVGRRRGQRRPTRSITRSSPSDSYCLGVPKRRPLPPPTTIVQICSAPGTSAQGSTVTDVMAHEETLARTDFFADAHPDALGAVASAGHELHLIRGDVLFNEGDPPEALYLVLRGRIAIALANPIDRRESVVALMEAGDLFGEMGMLDDGPRSAMARALEPTTVLSIPYEPVLAMFDENPKLLWNVARLLAQRIRVTDEALADSVFLDVTGPHREAAARAGRRHRRVHAAGHPGGTRRHGRRLPRTGQQGDRELHPARLARTARPHLPHHPARPPRTPRPLSSAAPTSGGAGPDRAIVRW